LYSLSYLFEFPTLYSIDCWKRCIWCC